MENIKLEAGKYYRTRDGRKAFVSGKNPFSDTQCCICGFIEGYGSTSWTIDGNYYSDKSDVAYDLIAEWKEPKRIKGWVNIYSEVVCTNRRRRFASHDSAFPGSDIFLTRQEANRAASHAAEIEGDTRIACIEIDVLEGEGLDGSAR